MPLSRQRVFRAVIALALMLIGGALMPVAAQEVITPENLPATYRQYGFTYHAQWWNNCGPATLTMALSRFGYGDDQGRAADWLKPNSEDKNVSPWQMAEFVNTQVPEMDVYALIRYGGTLELLKALVANDFVVIIESGYDPERANQGWMGHYLSVIGYDDARQVIITNDSYDGEGLEYSYLHIQQFWQHFNYIYLVIYEQERLPELEALLGDNADEETNLYNTFDVARNEAIAPMTYEYHEAFAWFNMGAARVMLGIVDQTTAEAFNQARNIGLPWRTLWYRFEMYDAYLAVEDYNTVIDMAGAVRNDGGGQYVEETFYYAGLAREGLGETSRALENYRAAVNFNPNFTPAVERLAALGG